MIDIKKIFNRPCIMAIIGNRNSGKSNLIYNILEQLNKNKYLIVTFGLKYPIGQSIYSLRELENVKDSVIIIDEFMSLFDLEDRHKRRAIENTFRLLSHNNNILVLGGLPENFKKFISSKIEVLFFKEVSISDFINGSEVKKVLIDYHGEERGEYMLKLEKNECIYFDGNYKKLNIPYLKNKDSKRFNKKLWGLNGR